MNPHLQNILHDITVRLAKLEESQKREWVELTEDEIFKVAAFGNDGGCFGDFQWQHDTVGFVRAIEAKLKEKNT